MLKIGLTGSICSGHEKVAEMFKSYNVPVFDADIALKFLINYREDIIKNIRIQFGDNIYNHGAINPDKFNTTQKFDRLVDIAELELLKLYESWRLTHNDAPYTIFKFSILFERNLQKSMNHTISTFCPKDERAMFLSKTGISLTRAYDIIESEMDDLKKNQQATWIIHNYDNNTLPLIGQVKKVHESIMSKSISTIWTSMDLGTSVKNIFT